MKIEMMERENRSLTLTRQCALLSITGTNYYLSFFGQTKSTTSPLGLKYAKMQKKFVTDSCFNTFVE